MESDDQGRVRLADAMPGTRRCVKESSGSRATVDEQRPKRASDLEQGRARLGATRRLTRRHGTTAWTTRADEVDGVMQPYSPEEWASLESCSPSCASWARRRATREVKSRGTSRPAQGRSDVGAGIVLDLRESYTFVDPNDREMARRRMRAENPTLTLGPTTTSSHNSAQERKKEECIAKMAFLCSKCRWYVDEQRIDNALWEIRAIDDLLWRPGVHRAAPPRARDRPGTGYITNVAELSQYLGGNTPGEGDGGRGDAPRQRDLEHLRRRRREPADTIEVGRG